MGDKMRFYFRFLIFNMQQVNRIISNLQTFQDIFFSFNIIKLLTVRDVVLLLEGHNVASYIGGSQFILLKLNIPLVREER